MPPKSRSNSRKPQKEVPTKQNNMASKQAAESIGQIKKQSSSKRTIKQQEAEAKEMLADQKVLLAPQPVVLNE